MKDEPLKIDASLCTMEDVVYYIRDCEFRNGRFTFTNINETNVKVKARLLEEAQHNPNINVCV